ncbi:hypothetical protein SAMN06265374_1449 [Roseibium denhamense]|uniref:Uncharacterized protein n=1 Tax=Roseibium denhamense TaxID=76305 RepID=A0ABY1NP09_9HYPH|nr:hypothetical protein SAMN06265374_1449 [Roseibium denhamense]
MMTDLQIFNERDPGRSSAESRDRDATIALEPHRYRIPLCLSGMTNLRVLQTPAVIQ